MDVHNTSTDILLNIIFCQLILYAVQCLCSFAASDDTSGKTVFAFW